MVIKINTESIKISQLLKLARITDTGGAAKYFLQENEVMLNGKRIESKSTKIRQNDIVWINNETVLEVE
ncbi:RNA-binding S4 domain-containing protein [Mycoplasmopsis edwardii]|nr:RNA-binding S4 domain-containing protein [Mycoplasmopsis edwardii]